MNKVDNVTKNFDPNMMNAMGLMGNNMGEAIGDDIIDVDAKEIKQDMSHIIKTVTPFIINSREKNGRIIGTLTFLCLDGNDELITLNRNYILNDEDENDILKLIEFHVDSMYSNAIICGQLVMNHLPCYISDFKFEVENTSDNRVFLNATETRDNSIKRFEFTPEVYSALNFIDDYIFKEEIENDYDLRLATAIGSKENLDSKFFVVNNIDSIISMVSTDRKPEGLFGKIRDVFDKEVSTSIGIVFKATGISDETSETVSLLTPFDIGVSFDKSKFKGDSVEDLQNNYYGDSDQYVATLIADESRLYGIDKEYMMIRGKSKDGKVKIFLLDSSIKEQLIHMIKDY